MAEGDPKEETERRDIAQALPEQRFRTLALADQIGEDRWREPLLPGGRSLHDQMAHLLAWDEWATGVFDISALRALPPVLVEALRDSDEYNARTERRFRGLGRDDVLVALQGTPERVLASAMSSAPRGQPWEEHRIAELAGLRIPPAYPTGTSDDARGPSVGQILLHLLEHERIHAAEIGAAFGIEPHIERFMP
jgi:hypothetical protein